MKKILTVLMMAVVAMVVLCQLCASAGTLQIRNYGSDTVYFGTKPGSCVEAEVAPGTETNPTVVVLDYPDGVYGYLWNDNVMTDEFEVLAGEGSGIKAKCYKNDILILEQ